MTKDWNKTGEGQYAFSVDRNVIGSMEFPVNAPTGEANCRVENTDFVMKRAGFWRSTIEIRTLNGQMIGTMYPEKWYVGSWVFDYKEKQYKVVVRNNPMAEWVIFEGSAEIAAYGLVAENGKVSVRITGSNRPDDPLFDFLLWYLFVPIATENMGDSFTFLMLLRP